MADTDARINRPVVSAAAILVAINVAVYLVMFTAWIAGGQPGTVDRVADTLALPSDAGLWLHRPWTIITYMFTQYAWWHMACNMIVLFLFASLAGRNATGKQITAIYLAGGLAAGALYLISGECGLSSGMLVGSSASVMALMGAVAVSQPRLRLPVPVIGKLSVVQVVVVLVVFDMLGMAAGNVAGHLSHLAGLAAGCAAARFIAGHKSAPAPTEEIGTVLEKVRRSGFASLDERERHILFSDYKR